MTAKGGGCLLQKKREMQEMCTQIFLYSLIYFIPQTDLKRSPLGVRAGEINMAVAAFWRDGNVNGPTGFLMSVVPQTK